MITNVLLIGFCVLLWIVILGCIKQFFFDDFLENNQLRKQNEWLENKMKSLMYDYYQLKKKVEED